MVIVKVKVCNNLLGLEYVLTDGYWFGEIVLFVIQRPLNLISLRNFHNRLASRIQKIVLYLGKINPEPKSI